MNVGDGPAPDEPTPRRHRAGLTDLRWRGALRHRNFRLFWFGQMVSLVGTWMQSVAQAWLVLQLTHDPFWLGVSLPTGWLATVFGWESAWQRRQLAGLVSSTGVLAVGLGDLPGIVRMSEALDVWGNRRGPYVVHSFLTLAVDLRAGLDLSFDDLTGGLTAGVGVPPNGVTIVTLRNPINADTTALESLFPGDPPEHWLGMYLIQRQARNYQAAIRFHPLRGQLF